MCGAFRWIVFAAALMFAISANAAAIIKIYGAEIKVYKDHRGATELTSLKRSEVKLPAAVTSNLSPKGYIQVRFEFVDGSRKPSSITGWVRKRRVKLDRRKVVDVSCKKTGRNEPHATRGRRGLGEGC